MALKSGSDGKGSRHFAITIAASGALENQFMEKLRMLTHFLRNIVLLCQVRPNKMREFVKLL